MFLRVTIALGVVLFLVGLSPGARAGTPRLSTLRYFDAGKGKTVSFVGHVVPFRQLPKRLPHGLGEAGNLPRRLPHGLGQTGNLPGRLPHGLGQAGNLPKHLPHGLGSVGNLPIHLPHPLGPLGRLPAQLR